jgi:3-methyladenine DNA glycosylase AlkD
MNPDDVTRALKAVATPERAKANAWFFKTGPGQYGEGDQFLGVTVPNQRKIAKQFKDMPLSYIEELLHSPWHEVRLTTLFIMVFSYQKGNEKRKADIANLYLANAKYINNWDLVDSSASYILGPWLENSPYKMKTLKKLAHSKNLWERRIAMISTLYYISRGSADEALQMAEILLHDKHDLIQKAVGWMLREVGKMVDRDILLAFLDEHAATMPRTALRYAIEHLTPELRRTYLDKKREL